MTNAENIRKAAKIAKTLGLAIAAQGGGYCAIQRVTYDAKGKSTVDTIEAWLSGEEAIASLEALSKAAQKKS